MPAKVMTFKEDVLEKVLLNGTLTTATTDYQDMGDVHTARFRVGIALTDNAVDMKLVQATSAAGAGVKDILDENGDPFAITQLVDANDAKQAALEIDAAALDVNNGFRYVAAVVTVAGTTTGFVDYAATPRKKPTTQPAAMLQHKLFVGGK